MFLSFCNRCLRICLIYISKILYQSLINIISTTKQRNSHQLPKKPTIPNSNKAKQKKQKMRYNMIKKMCDKSEVQVHQQKQRVEVPQLEKQNKNSTQSPQMNYYSQFCRLYLTNTILNAQLKELNVQKNQLISKLSRIEKRAEELSEGHSGQPDEKKRRIRRAASEISRHYKCPVEGCNKSYGSEGSLNQHLKIKHVDMYRTLVSYAPNNETVKESDDEDESL